MCNSVKRRQLLKWAVVVTSFNCCIKSEELRETVGLKVKERKARDERDLGYIMLGTSLFHCNIDEDFKPRPSISWCTKLRCRG